MMLIQSAIALQIVAGCVGLGIIVLLFARSGK